MSIEKGLPNTLKHIGVGFTTFLNETMSLIPDAGALGIYVYLLSKPEDWIIRSKELEKRFNCGKDYITTRLNILKKLGLYEKYSTRDEKGKITGWVTNLYKTPKPCVDEEKLDDNPDADFPESGSTHMWTNPPHTKERLNTKEIYIKTLSKNDQNINKEKIPVSQFKPSEDLQIEIMEMTKGTKVDLQGQHLAFAVYYEDRFLSIKEWNKKYKLWFLKAAQFKNNKRNS